MRPQTGLPRTSNACVTALPGRGRRVGRHAGIRGGSPRCGGSSRGRVGSGGKGRAAPVVAAATNELTTVFRPEPRHALTRIDRGSGGNVLPESEERRVPTDAHGARAELIPPRVRDARDVLEPEHRATIRRWLERHLEPGHLPAEFPRHGHDARWLASRDRAAGIALELVAATEAKVAGDWEEPPRNALLVRHGIPEIVDGGVVGARGHDDARRLA